MEKDDVMEGGKKQAREWVSEWATCSTTTRQSPKYKNTWCDTEFKDGQVASYLCMETSVKKLLSRSPFFFYCVYSAI